MPERIESIEYRVITAGEVRVDPTAGTFEGIALRWSTVDAYGTQFTQGAFAETLDTDPYAYLWMHDARTVIGQFTAKELDAGLAITGAYDDTPDGQAARVRAKSGSAPDLSIGFSRYATDPDDETIITGARLVEVSQITRRMAAVPGASLTGVRARSTRLSANLEHVARERALARLGLIRRRYG
jgi:HK97 family phage prohead protease